MAAAVWGRGAGRLLVLGAVGAAGMLTAACSPGGRAGPPASSGVVVTSPAAIEPGAVAAGSGAPAPAASQAAVAGAGTTASALSPQDEQAANQSLASLDQDLTQAGSQLSSAEQAAASGESDVPGN